MKKILLTLSCMFFLMSGQAQGWKTGWLFNGQPSETTSIACDKSGNIYTSMWFSANTFSLGSVSTTGIGLAWWYGGVLFKTDSSGNALWVTSSPSNSTYPMSIAVDNEGNVVMLGTCSASFQWQGYSIYDTLTANTNYFLAKFDPSGTILWLKKVVSMGASLNGPVSGNVAIDASDNIYIAGEYIDSCSVVGTDTFFNKGSEDIFLAKYDGSGNFKWAKSIAGNNDDRVNGLSITSSGDVYLNGAFASDSLTIGSATFKPIPFSTSSFGTWYGSPLLLAKYDSSGNLLWVKSPKGCGIWSNSVVDHNDNVYMNGCSVSMYFDSSHGYPYDALAGFVIKYDKNGNVVWMRRMDGNYIYGDEGIAIDGCDNIWVTQIMGEWLGVPIIFDDGTVASPPSNSCYPILIAKYSNNGSLKEYAALQYSVMSNHVATGPNGNVYLTASYQPTTQETYFTIGSTTYPVTSGYANAYVAEYLPNRSFFDTIPLPPVDTTQCRAFYLSAPHGISSCVWNGINDSSQIYAGSTGTYTLVESANGCIYTDTFNVVLDSSLCTAARRIISAYPNPVTNHVTIGSSSDNVTIMDMTGYVMYTGKGGEIDVSNYKAGTYLVKNGMTFIKL